MQYYTLCITMSCRPSSPNQCLQLRRSVGADEIKNPLLERIEGNIRDRWLTQALSRTRVRFQHVFFYPTGSLHPSTESSSINCSQLYIKKNSRAARITSKVTNSSAKTLPFIRSPHHTPVPPSPALHYSTISQPPRDIDANRSPF